MVNDEEWFDSNIIFDVIILEFSVNVRFDNIVFTFRIHDEVAVNVYSNFSELQFLYNITSGIGSHKLVDPTVTR